MGVDVIHANFLLYEGPVLVSTLTRILNESYKRGELYKMWRMAEIIPKTSSATQIVQFRPISLLSVVVKIMEGVLARRLRRHFFLFLVETPPACKGSAKKTTSAH